MQSVFDELYADSVKGRQFRNLVDLIQRPENIMLAYRNIRKNSGSKTAGVDNKTISDLNRWNDKKLVSHVRRKLSWYVPNAVRRVEIPKDNGKTRPLGIPTIMDRLIQQCILQVLEPICEAKFFKRSNGFRPNHSAENAIAQAERMIQNVGCHYVIDIELHHWEQFDLRVWNCELNHDFFREGCKVLFYRDVYGTMRVIFYTHSFQNTKKEPPQI